jgi:transaldolase
MNNKQIKLYIDGPSIEQINEDHKVQIDGYTFNPSLFKKNGAKDYLEYSKKILTECKDKPVSLEVFADDEINMIRQAKILNKLGKNVYVKIPIVYTSGESTFTVIENLCKENIKLNITAIFLIEQIKKIIPLLKDTSTILSIFAGRLYDSGIDAKEKMIEINNFVHQNSSCLTLWASTRMAYDYIAANSIKTDIITMQIEHIKKLNLIGTSPSEYSIKTVKQFYQDAQMSGFKI